MSLRFVIPLYNAQSRVTNDRQSRVPESLFPGRFDFWGHSHTWWHILVVLSIVSHVAGLWSAWDYNHRHALCRVG